MSGSLLLGEPISSISTIQLRLIWLPQVDGGSLVVLPTVDLWESEEMQKMLVYSVVGKDEVVLISCTWISISD